MVGFVRGGSRGLLAGGAVPVADGLSACLTCEPFPAERATGGMFAGADGWAGQRPGSA